jgi:hypothetical protein
MCTVGGGVKAGAGTGANDIPPNIETGGDGATLVTTGAVENMDKPPNDVLTPSDEDTDTVVGNELAFEDTVTGAGASNEFIF